MIFLPELEMTLTDLLFYFHKGKEGDHDLPLSLSHPDSLPLPPRWLHHDRPVSGSVSILAPMGRRFWARQLTL